MNKPYEIRTFVFGPSKDNSEELIERLKEAAVREDFLKSTFSCTYINDVRHEVIRMEFYRL